MNFNILVIDDNPEDIFFFQKAINSSELKTEVTVACDGMAGMEAIRNGKFDCVFLDYMLPGTSGLHLLKEARSEGIDTPIVILTGQRNEQTVVKLMQSGANDYISKDALTSETLRLSIENVDRIYKVNKEKRLAEQALKISEARLAEAQKIANVGNWEYDMSSRQLFLSAEASRILDFSALPSLPKFIKRVYWEDLGVLKDCFYILKGMPSYGLNFRFYSSEKLLLHLNAKGEKVLENGKATKIIGTIQDVTLLKTALNETKKAKVKSKATTIVFSVAILIFLISEAFLDPFVDALTTSLMISLSFKGGLALFLKPVESFLEKFMLSRV
jgi:DNA-binding response OmpR family regulator